MLRLSPTVVRAWADEIGAASRLLAELYFRLVHVIGVIAAEEVLSTKLYLKGGTALNKMFLGGLSRLSVDIGTTSVPKSGSWKSGTSSCIDCFELSTRRTLPTRSE